MFKFKKKLNYVYLIIPILIIIFIIFAKTIKKIDMRKLETQKIYEDIYTIQNNFFYMMQRLNVNMYLIKTGEHYIIVDAGVNMKQVKKGVKKLQINPDKVVAVFITHSHFDHIASLSMFKNAVLYASETETNSFIKYLENNKYQLLKDKQEIKISGLKIKCILTQGHSAGSMSYQINKKHLFVGDIIGLKDGKVILVPSMFNEGNDSLTIKNSIKKVANLEGVENIFTSHYGYSSNSKKAFENWIDYSD